MCKNRLWLSLDIGPEFALKIERPKRIHRGGYFVYKLPVDRGTFLELRPKDSRNNNVPLDAIDNEVIEATSSNPEIITVELLSDQRIKVLPVGPLGTAQVNVTLSIPSEPPVTLTGLLEIETMPGGVASFTLEPGGDFPI